MKWPETRWERLTFYAWAFTGLYLLAIVVTQPGWEWVTGNSLKWPDWLRDITSAGLAVALMIVSISYGGVLTNYYEKLTGFGISEVRVDRRGADAESTE